MVALSPDEIARRRPVWDGMADLFLDTETRPSLGFAAVACAESGYDDATLERIWRHEVSPVVGPNLLSVAGEWAGFDLDWLQERIEQRRATPLDRIPELLNRGHHRELQRLTAWFREVDPERRLLLARGLSSLVWIALKSQWTSPLDPQNYAPGEPERLWTQLAEPLLIALHVEGHDPPLQEILALGRASTRGRLS